MCRILVILNDVTYCHDAIRQHMVELEKSLGGDGNGLYLAKQERLFKTSNINACLKNFDGVSFFHTRKKSAGAVCKRNCHPFTYKSYVFMHNGTAGTYTTPTENTDTYNLVSQWIDKHVIPRTKKDLDELNWYGNIALTAHGSDVVRLYVKRFLEFLRLRDGTTLITSEITPALKKHIIFRYKIEEGTYLTHFVKDKAKTVPVPRLLKKYVTEWQANYNNLYTTNAYNRKNKHNRNMSQYTKIHEETLEKCILYRTSNEVSRKKMYCVKCSLMTDCIFRGYIKLNLKKLPDELYNYFYCILTKQYVGDELSDNSCNSLCLWACPVFNEESQPAFKKHVDSALLKCSVLNKSMESAVKKGCVNCPTQDKCGLFDTEILFDNIDYNNDVFDDAEIEEKDIEKEENQASTQAR